MDEQQVPLSPEPSDLGFGAVVGAESRHRLLNRDGSFNVGRKGLHLWARHNPYHWLLTTTWPRFLLLLVGSTVLMNALFAFLYLLAGPNAIDSDGVDQIVSPFWRAFFFSVQTLSTIGYGHLTPVGPAANGVVVAETIFGFVAIALSAGLLFARFSRPVARIVFSRNALIAPYRAGHALEFRIVNERSTQIIELEAKVVYSWRHERDGRPVREFVELPLERRKVAFFPLSWTVVHPITESSPLRHATAASVSASDAEILILLTGVDETFSQIVHARSSYKPDEIMWNARFEDMFSRDDDGLMVDIGRLDDFRLEGPPAS